ncbi:MAG: flagellar protein FliT [Selenomonadaceae bacterium]|nr:flagellar protein FliT [Selenomonadaceae bacterium]
MSPEEVVKAAKNLWTNYLSLTHELLKFIDRQDIDTFILIVSNRDQLIKKIDELPSKDYCKLDEFKAIAEQIKPLDREIMYKARAWLNKSRRQNNVVRSYDLGVSLAMNQSIGFNRKY